MADGYVELAQDVQHREYTGEHYDDGITTDQLRIARDGSYKAFRKELRRQQAQFTFGMRDKPPSQTYDDY